MSSCRATNGKLFIAQLSDNVALEDWPSKWLFDKREKS